MDKGYFLHHVTPAGVWAVFVRCPSSFWWIPNKEICIFWLDCFLLQSLFFMGWGVGGKEESGCRVWLHGWYRVCFSGGTSGKESTCQCRRCKRRRFNPWVGKIPWSSKWQPAPVFLPWKFHGQRSLAVYSPWGHKELDTTVWLSTHACVVWGTVPGQPWESEVSCPVTSCGLV